MTDLCGDPSVSGGCARPKGHTPGGHSMYPILDDPGATPIPELLAELEQLKAMAAKDQPWNDAIDWLLNSRHTADPGIQSAFWGMVEGRFTREQADTGCFQYDAEGNAYIPTDDEQPDTNASTTSQEQ